MTRRVRAAVAIAVAVLLCGPLAACSNSADGSPEPAISVSDSEGSLVIGEGSELPADWPTDIPAPEGLLLQSVVTADASTIALYLGPGNASLIAQAVTTELVAKGYTAQGSTSAGFETTTTYTKGSTSVDVSVSQTGTDASITLTVRSGQ